MDKPEQNRLLPHPALGMKGENPLTDHGGTCDSVCHYLDGTTQYRLVSKDGSAWVDDHLVEWSEPDDRVIGS